MAAVSGRPVAASVTLPSAHRPRLIRSSSSARAPPDDSVAMREPSGTLDRPTTTLVDPGGVPARGFAQDAPGARAPGGRQVDIDEFDCARITPAAAAPGPARA